MSDSRDVTESATSPSSADSPGTPRHRHHRMGLILLVILGAIVCLLMGYWQLSRWNSNTGSYQNLGYSLEWPVFAAFLIFAYRRFVRLEAEHSEDGGEADDYTDSGTPRSAVITEIPSDILPSRYRSTPPPEEQDDALRAYNAYLATLHEADTASDQATPSDTPSREDRTA